MLTRLQLPLVLWAWQQRHAMRIWSDYALTYTVYLDRLSLNYTHTTNHCSLIMTSLVNATKNIKLWFKKKEAFLFFSTPITKPKRPVYLHLAILFSERSPAIIINIVRAFVAHSLGFEAIDASETRLIVHADEEGWESLMIILRLRKGPVITDDDWTWWLHGRLWLTEGTTIAPNVSGTLQLRKTSADIICQRGRKWSSHNLCTWHVIFQKWFKKEIQLLSFEMPELKLPRENLHKPANESRLHSRCCV